MGILGGPKTCPICKGNISGWPPAAFGSDAVCQNCGARFFREWFWDNKIFMVDGTGGYVHKLLAEDGWKMVREGKEPFVCPGCGVQPKALMKRWKGSFKEDTISRLRCECCGRDLVVKGNEIMEELPDEVSESPNYEVVVVGEDIKWPDGCCVCLEQPVTPVPIGLSTSQWLGTTIREAEATLRLPFCEVHLGKAEKHVRGDLLIIGGPTVIGVRLQFRNPKFARRFRELNPLVHLKISDGVAIKMQ